MPRATRECCGNSAHFCYRKNLYQKPQLSCISTLTADARFQRMQTAIPTLFMRGGTSRGPFFHPSDLPVDPDLRDAVLLAVMGSPDTRQIDGLGGAHPLRSKIGIVERSETPGVDLDFLFGQVSVDRPVVDMTPNCGNMLSAVVPYALETGLVRTAGDLSQFRVLTRNTGLLCDITVKTPGGQVTYEGEAEIDGVPGRSAPILIDFLDTAGSVCDGLLPTGEVLDRVQISGVGMLEVTCIDNGMPMVLMRARDLGRSGYESVEALNADVELKERLEKIRLAAGEKMGLGDVRDKPYPKMCLVAPPQGRGAVSTRCFIPHVCHNAIGVLAAVTVASACVMKGSVAERIARVPRGEVKAMPVEHPSGAFGVEVEVDPADERNIVRARILRTARLLMRGEVMIPGSVWKGKGA